MKTGASFTKYGWFLCVWILLIPFQYGYHISVLNQLQAVLSCKQVNVAKGIFSLPTCIPMDDFLFSVITSVFTVGGLVGSLVGSNIVERYGLKGGARLSALLVAFGAGVMALSGNAPLLALGRFFVGTGSGLGLCVSPIYIAEIAPSKISSAVGILTQLGIVLGIFLTQLIGLNFATPTGWRFVFLISFSLGVVQWIASGIMVDPPKRLPTKDEVARAERRIWGTSPSLHEGPASPTSSIFETSSETDETVTNPLLAGEDADIIQRENKSLSLPSLLLHWPKELRRPMLIVCFSMIGQQVSGINCVLYYSNVILSKALPDIGPYVSLGITIVNMLMTFPPIILIEKLGRRQLLTISTVGALLSLVTVAVALDSNWVVVGSIGIITFVMSFAIGLGPIPFILIPEVSPFYAVSALASLGLSLNWIANFIVGLVFLPLRNWLSGGDPGKEGRVFLVFAAVLFLVMSVVRVVYR